MDALLGFVLAGRKRATATRARWLADHRAFHRREAEREGFKYSDGLAVLFERFTLVWAP